MPTEIFTKKICYLEDIFIGTILGNTLIHPLIAPIAKASAFQVSRHFKGWIQPFKHILKGILFISTYILSAKFKIG